MSTAQAAIDEHSIINSQQDKSKNQYLTFILAGEEYGVDILRVQEIKGWDKVTKIPNAPRYIKGVMNLRGTIVPIIDLRQRFNLDELEYGPMTVVIVLKVETEFSNRTMGVVVDAVSDVYDIASGQMRPPPDFGDVISIEFLRGLATVNDKMVIILDIDHLLTSNELEFLNSATPHKSNNSSDTQSRSSLNASLLEKSFAALAPQGEQIVERFYQELFTRHPDIKPMFAHVSPKEQQTKLLSALKLVVSNLRNPQKLTETLQNLGKRHKDYGADTQSYKKVCATLLDVLKDSAGNQWSSEIHHAWSDALQTISSTMLTAATE